VVFHLLLESVFNCAIANSASRGWVVKCHYRRTVEIDVVVFLQRDTEQSVTATIKLYAGEIILCYQICVTINIWTGFYGTFAVLIMMNL
jgi:hypothetical protein